MSSPDFSITEARKKLTRLARELNLASGPGSVTITQRGKPVLALMSWDLYESIVETLDILGDEGLVSALRQALEDVRKGRTVRWEDVKAELGL